ncbi:MAG: Phage Tail Collar Domain protein [Burkholderiaceae bacterium]|nr:Phage Tail Collar Domain protein [Burkholderiaceae bacterium]
MKFMQKPARHALALALACSTIAAAPQAFACAGDGTQLLGSICIVSYVRGCPSGFFPADGRTLTIQQYSALFSLIGATFGGNGSTNFMLPNLNGRVPVGTGPATSISGAAPTSAVALGQLRGAEGVTLTAAQSGVPAHVHPATFTATTGNVQATIPAQTGSGLQMNAAVTTAALSAGGEVSTPVNNNGYWLAGRSGSGSGPYTKTQPGSGTTATLNGISASVDATNLRPTTPAQTITIQAVNGGSVTVNPNTGANAAAATPTLPPQLGLTYCIAWSGLYPSFD